MKKLLMMAAALTVLFACNKENNSTKNIPTLHPTPKADYAIMLEIPNHSLLASEVKTIEFTGEGNYMMELPLKKGAPAASVEDVEVVVGQFNATEVDKDSKLNVLYEIVDKEGCSVSFEKPTKANEIQVTFTWNGKTVTGIANILSPMVQTLFTMAINRQWSIEETDLNVEGSGVKFGKIYKGCDLQAIAGDLKEQGININASKLSGHTVKSVEFTWYGSLKIEFTGAPAYYGNFGSFSDNGGFSYTFHGENAGDAIISGTSTGSVSFNNKQQPVLMLRSKVKDENNGKEYDCTINLTLK